MTGKEHHYAVTLVWTGNRGDGTRNYRAYDRTHDITAPGKPAIAGSADAAFRGDPARWNPEELLVASLSACHKLWYLHLCAQDGIVVVAYEDHATGVMVETPDSAGAFTSVTLQPIVMIAAGSNATRARDLHHAAHDMCFIARSVRFEVGCEPQIAVAT